MHAAPDTVASTRSHLTQPFVPVRNLHSRRISLRRAPSTAITAYTSETVESFTTPASLTAYRSEDGWKTFLSNSSLEVVAYGFDTKHRSSIAAKWWSVLARGWANDTICC